MHVNAPFPTWNSDRQLDYNRFGLPFVSLYKYGGQANDIRM